MLLFDVVVAVAVVAIFVAAAVDVAICDSHTFSRVCVYVCVFSNYIDELLCAYVFMLNCLKDYSPSLYLFNH